MMNDYLFRGYNREIESITKRHYDTRAWSTGGDDIHPLFSYREKKTTRINITSGLRHICVAETV